MADAKEMYPWEKPYPKKDELKFLHMVRSTSGVTDVRPVISPLLMSAMFFPGLPESQRTAVERPFPLLEIDHIGDPVFMIKYFTHYFFRSFDDVRLSGATREDGRILQLMVSNVYHRYEKPSDADKEPFRKTLLYFRTAVDYLIYEKLGINVPELKLAYIEKLKGEGKIRSEKDKYEAENTIDNALSADCDEPKGITTKSKEIEEIIHELIEASQ